MTYVGDFCRSPERAVLILPGPRLCAGRQGTLRSGDQGIPALRGAKLGDGEIRIGCESRPRVRPRSKDPPETRQSGRARHGQCAAICGL